jgi:4-oxalocrotonate tautomerase
MPIVRVTLKKGRSPEYLAAVSDGIYAAMREQFLLDEGDKFHIFEQLDDSAFSYDRNFGVREARTDDFMIIQINADARRVFEKTATIKAICDKLGASPGVLPQDIVVVLHTSLTLEDVSLGYGEPVFSLTG